MNSAAWASYQAARETPDGEDGCPHPFFELKKAYGQGGEEIGFWISAHIHEDRPPFWGTETFATPEEAAADLRTRYPHLPQDLWSAPDDDASPDVIAIARL